MFKKRLNFYFFVLFVLSYSETFASFQKTKNSNLNNEYLSFKLKSANSNKKIFDVASTDKSLEGQLLISELQDVTDADLMIKSEIVNIKSTFKNSHAAYGGHVTATINCESKNFYSESHLDVGQSDSTVILAVANQRKLFGVCLTKDIKFAVLTWLYLEKNKNRFLKLSLIKPILVKNEIQKEQNKLIKVLKSSLNQIGGIE